MQIYLLWEPREDERDFPAIAFNNRQDAQNAAWWLNKYEGLTNAWWASMQYEVR